MPIERAEVPHIHFESRTTKPRVFRITPELIAAATARNNIDVSTSLGDEWRDLSGLSQAVGLVTAVDLLADPQFPRRDLEQAAPKLRWIHVTGAGMSRCCRFDWLPPRVTLTNNGGVHSEKIRGVRQ